MIDHMTLSIKRGGGNLDPEQVIYVGIGN